MTDTTAAINATNLGCSITCKDLEASIRFYRDAIGFVVTQTFANEGKAVAAVVAAGDCSIVLNPDDGAWADLADRRSGDTISTRDAWPSRADVNAAAVRGSTAGVDRCRQRQPRGTASAA